MSKNYRKFMLLWAGELISAIGSGLTSFGLGVYVYQTTGSASAMTLVTLLAFLPNLLLSVPAGMLADKYDRRVLMILGDSLSALGLVFILICHLNGGAALWQICVGVTISSIFSSLLEPAYKATITDLLSEKEYTKASGMVQIAGSSRYLISPLLAGLLLSVTDISLLLIIDISTIAITVLATLVVRKGIAQKARTTSTSAKEDFKEGFKAINSKRGLVVLLIVTSVMTFFIGFIQTLSTPMILGFTDSATLGVIETICASGMLVASVVIGFLPIKKGYQKLISIGLFMAGIFMMIFAWRANQYMICVGGFLFFLCIPFANTGLDYLFRTNVDNEVQGRAWGIVGTISQIGYVFAYGLSGVFTDYIFAPLMEEDGALSSSVGQVIGTGSGRGAALLIIIARICLCLCAIVLHFSKSVKALEKQNVEAN